MPSLRELAILRVGRLSRAAYEVFQHERIAREAGVAEDKIAALRDATIEAAGLQRQREGRAALHRRRRAQRQGVGQDAEGGPGAS